MSDDDKVKRLNVRFKKPPEEDAPQLVVVDKFDGCNHMFFYKSGDGRPGRMQDVQYLVREGETEVECGNCGTKLDPMFVLQRLANKETQWRRNAEQYQDEMKRLHERTKTKCQHCGGMTRISDARRGRAFSSHHRSIRKRGLHL